MMYLLICILLEFEKIIIIIKNSLFYCKMNIPSHQLRFVFVEREAIQWNQVSYFLWRKKSFINFKSDKRALAYAGQYNSMWSNSSLTYSSHIVQQGLGCYFIRYRTLLMGRQLVLASSFNIELSNWSTLIRYFWAI